jgi:hypothetical protein
MTRFVIGFLLGAILGIAGTAAFLIVYGGGDYLVSTSPRLRQLEGALSRADEDRDWLKSRLREATEVTHRLEARFEALAGRFERLSSAAGEPSPQATDEPAAAASAADGSASDDAARGEPAAADAAPPSLDAIPTAIPAAEPSPLP